MTRTLFTLGGVALGIFVGLFLSALKLELAKQYNLESAQVYIETLRLQDEVSQMQLEVGEQLLESEALVDQAIDICMGRVEL